MTQFYNPELITEACSADDLNLLKKHLKEGVPIDLTDDDGQTGLMFAASIAGSQCLPFLLSQPIDVNYQDNEGWTALSCAAGEGRLDNVKLLLDHHANPYITDNEGLNIALWAAIINYRAEILELLCSHVDFNQNQEGYLALLKGGMTQSNLDCFKILFDHAIDQKDTAKYLLSHLLDTSVDLDSDIQQYINSLAEQLRLKELIVDATPDNQNFSF